jgi:hypothetical protein
MTCASAYMPELVNPCERDGVGNHWPRRQELVVTCRETAGNPAGRSEPDAGGIGLGPGHRGLTLSRLAFKSPWRAGSVSRRFADLISISWCQQWASNPHRREPNGF